MQIKNNEISDDPVRTAIVKNLRVTKCWQQYEGERTSLFNFLTQY